MIFGHSMKRLPGMLVDEMNIETIGSMWSECDVPVGRNESEM